MTSRDTMRFYSENPLDSRADPSDNDAWIQDGVLVDRGSPIPYGPTRTASGVNFAIYSRHATAMILMLYHDDGGSPFAEITLNPQLNRTGDVWHIRIRHEDPKHSRHIRYNWRADGPHDKSKGHYFDVSRPLLDPYARALSGGEKWGDPDIPHQDGEDAPKIGRRRCRIAATGRFDWEGDAPLVIPMEETVIYEIHPRGFTRHESSGVTHPGTFLGITEKIPYLKELGVTAVELMPVFEFDENENHRRHPKTGEPLRNYWGYSPVAFFCPKNSYASSPADAGAVNEFKEMVKRLHRAGIEVILDVVFNHTAEGDERGPVISFRGLDNAVYYLLDKQGKYRNFSGCGNTLNCNHPLMRAFILDVLHYWVAFMHVDGFRFDLASILGRGPDGEVLSNPPLLENIALDPVLAKTKIIAEAWDAGGLNQVGRFPDYGRWAEWNGYYRDDIRMFWRGDEGLVSRTASRLCGSDDLYSGRLPLHSINFVTAHDGFTMNDLVSYREKHNQDNGENNNDGENHNHSENFGVEGPTEDEGIRKKRLRQMKNYWATLLLSQGVPMILAGDEFARTQMGNNNAYCQDNELSWIDWRLAQKNADLARFARCMIAFRRRHPTLRRTRFFSGSGDISWFGEHNGNGPDWSQNARFLAYMLAGKPADDDDLFVMLNPGADWRRVNVPWDNKQWRKIVDTSRDSPDDIHQDEDSAPVVERRNDGYPLEPHSLVVFASRAH